MTATLLTVEQWAAVMLDPLKDRSYQHTKAGSSVTAFLAFKRISRRSERTLDSVERTLARFVTLRPATPIHEFTSEHVLEFLALHQPGSRPKIRSHLSEWFRWALAWDHIDRDPMLRVPSIQKEPPPVIDVFTEAEQHQLRTITPPDGALMELLLATGIRDGEARLLQASHVDLQERALRVHGKGRRDRLVPLPGRTVNRLAHMIVTEGIDPDDHLWYRRKANQAGVARIMRDRPIVYSGFHAWWARSVATAGVRYRKPHTTRHTYATLYLRAGGKLERLSRILGHAHVGITEQHYAHLNLADLHDDLELVMAARDWGLED